MSTMSALSTPQVPSGRASRELLSDYRTRLLLQEHERAERRRADLANQRSNLNSPDARIRAWEKVHALSLPSDPQHPILDVIAVATRLTMEQVLEEQRARKCAVTPAPACP